MLIACHRNEQDDNCHVVCHLCCGPDFLRWSGLLAVVPSKGNGLLAEEPKVDSLRGNLEWQRILEPDLMMQWKEAASLESFEQK